MRDTTMIERAEVGKTRLIPKFPPIREPKKTIEGDIDIENNIYPYANLVSSHLREATPMRERLESLESPAFFSAGSPFADKYSLGFLATRHLTDGLPEGGVKELIRFWDAVGKGTPWRTAFQQVFGKTTQEYYLSFEVLRQRGFK